MQCTSEVIKSNLHLSLPFTFSSISILHPYTIIEDRIATSACLLFHYLKSLLKFHLYVSISLLKEIFLSLFFPPLTIRHHRTVKRPTLHLDNDKFVKSKDRGDRNVSISCSKFSRKVKRIFVNYRDFTSMLSLSIPRHFDAEESIRGVRNKFAVCVVADEGCRRPLPADKKGGARWPDILFTLETPILCNRWRPRVLARTPSFRPPPRLPCFSMFIYSPCLTLLKSCFLYGYTRPFG